jgi:hypothetical protein
MARHHVGELQPPADEESILADEQGVGRRAPKTCEGRIDFAAGAAIALRLFECDPPIILPEN